MGRVPDVRAHVGTRRYRLAGAGRRVAADGVLVLPVSARRARRSDLVLAPVYWWSRTFHASHEAAEACACVPHSGSVVLGRCVAIASTISPYTASPVNTVRTDRARILSVLQKRETTRARQLFGQRGLVFVGLQYS